MLLALSTYLWAGLHNRRVRMRPERPRMRAGQMGSRPHGPTAGAPRDGPPSGAVEPRGSGQGAPAPGARHSDHMACGVEVARRYQAVEATEPAEVTSSTGSSLSV